MIARRLLHRHLLESVRLERWHRRAIYFVTAFLVASGAAWLGLHYLGHGNEASSGLPHPLEPMAMKLHGAAAMVALALYGSLINAHMRKAWRLGRNRASGSVVAAIVALLIATAWVLYYAGGESLRTVGSALHWGLGFAIVLILPLHIWLGRRSR